MMKWTVKVVSETENGHTAEQTLGAVERTDQLTLEDLGLSLEEAKRLLATLQRSMVTEQIKEYGFAYRGCPDCHQLLHTKGYYQTSFRSAFGRVPLRVRRLVSCSCQGEPQETFACLPVHDGGLVAPEWLFLQAKLASLIPFARVADLLADVLPAGDGGNAETVRSRLAWVGGRLYQERIRGQETQPAPQGIPAFRLVEPLRQRAATETTLGLDCGYVRNRHPRPERHFEVVAGRARGPDGESRGFAFVRDRGWLCPDYVREAVAGAGGDLSRMTILTDGDPGLRGMLPTLAPQSDHVLDWFHVAMRFQVLEQTAKGLVDEPPGVKAWVIKSLDRAKWHLWHGHVSRSLELLEDVQSWTHAKREATPLVIGNLRSRLGDLRRLVAANRDSIPCYARRYRYGLPISTAPAESAVNQIVSRRMLKKQQMRWSREGAHRLLEVRVKVLNGSLEDTFRRWYPRFHPPSARLQREA
jgi:hypothetical protein